MYSDDDIQYAFDATQVILEPDRRIDTFGTTRFEFHLITELMDNVGEVRVRNGIMNAERPQILTPTPYEDVSFDGFGEQAEAFADWFKRHSPDLSMVRYGFNFKKDGVSEERVHDPFPVVRDRIVQRVVDSGDPMSAVIHGVDDAWEICLLKFTTELIHSSQETNLFDFKRRGLI
ncbi:MAG: hypothetical protein ACI8XO_004738 [Verrucomicrobiales bacterium]|jgi:hypothetical protein